MSWNIFYQDDNLLKPEILEEEYNKLPADIKTSLTIREESVEIGGFKQFLSFYAHKRLKYYIGEEQIVKNRFLTIFFDNLWLIKQIKDVKQNIESLYKLEDWFDIDTGEIKLISTEILTHQQSNISIGKTDINKTVRNNQTVDNTETIDETEGVSNSQTSNEVEKNENSRTVKSLEVDSDRNSAGLITIGSDSDEKSFLFPQCDPEGPQRDKRINYPVNNIAGNTVQESSKVDNSSTTMDSFKTEKTNKTNNTTKTVESNNSTETSNTGNNINNTETTNDRTSNNATTTTKRNKGNKGEILEHYLAIRLPELRAEFWGKFDRLFLY